MDRGQAGRSFYFLSPRERKYKNGVRPRRDTKDRLGRWKASTGKTDERGGGDVRKEERVAGDGTTKYCKSGLAYFYFRGRGEKEKKSGWLMQELTVPEYEIKLPEKGGPGGPTVSFLLRDSNHITVSTCFFFFLSCLLKVIRLKLISRLSTIDSVRGQ